MLHRARALRSPLRTAGLALVVVLCISSPLAVLALIGVGVMGGQPAAFGVAPGESHDGRFVRAATTVTAANPPDPSSDRAPGLTLRRGCRWGQPGRDPYRGSTVQALTAAGLPAEVVRDIAARQHAGQKSGRLEISNQSMRHRADGREFASDGFALTFGLTLCLDSKVNFPRGHVEMADLYEVRDAQGRLHSVMVPDVCGNVSVLSARGERGVVAGIAARLARRSEDLAGLAEALTAPDRHAAIGAVSPGGLGAAGAAPAVTAPSVDLADDDVAGTGARARMASGSAVTAPGGPGNPAPSSGWGAADGLPGVGVGNVAMVGLGRVTEYIVPRAAAATAVAALAEVLSKRSDDLAALAKALGDRGSAEGGGASAPVREVPEPGTLLSVLVALAALGVQRWRRTPGA